MLDLTAKIWMAGVTLVIAAFFFATYYGIRKTEKKD
jgi:hypothetical protein